MSRKSRNNNEKTLKKLLSFNGKNQDVQDYLSAAKDSLAENDLLNFEIYLKKAVVKSEKNHLLLRKFASENIKNKVTLKKLINKELDVLDASISMNDEGIIVIKMPIILPFKKLKNYNSYPQYDFTKIEFKEIYDRVNFLYDLIEKLFYDFTSQNKIDSQMFNKKTIIFNNIYSKDTALDSIPDVDNFEYKDIINIISKYLSNGDDGFNSTDVLMTAHIGEDTYTEIYIYPYKISDTFFSSKSAEIIPFKKTEKSVA